MIKKIKNYLAIAALALIPAMPVLVPVSASAATSNTLTTCNNIAGGIRDGVNAATGSTDTACNTDAFGSNGLGGVARNAVNIFSIIVGAVSVIMIIYGGFRYITSGGESSRVGNAKNTLIYAIIGLIIVALAQVIVHFVLSQANAVGQ